MFSYGCGFAHLTHTTYQQWFALRSILPPPHKKIAVIKVTGDAELQVLSQIISLIYKNFRRFLADSKKLRIFATEI